MKRIVIAVIVFLQFPAGEAYSADQPSVRAVFDSLPLSFEANAGQFDPQVKFLARVGPQAVFLTAEGLALVLEKPGSTDGSLTVVRMEFLEPAQELRFEGVERLAGVTNYLSTGLRIASIPSYARVRYQETYPGIDVLFHGREGQLEYDFIVAPRADPGRIRLRLSGQESARVSASGDLVLATRAGELALKRPFAYQERDGQRSEVPVRYRLEGSEVRFQLAAYDPERTLVIDPLLTLSTFVSTSGGSPANAIALDGAGNIYITGETFSASYPVAGAYQTKKLGTSDAFVTKMTPGGTGLVYSTYIGGKNGSTAGRGIAVDAAGNAYITGRTTSSAYPVTAGAYRTTPDNSFITKLGPNGNTLVYSTFISAWQGNAIALDAAGNAFVAGQSSSGSGNAIVLKLNAAGSLAEYATSLGGSQEDIGHGIAVDAAGNAYIAGFSASTDFPTTPNAFQPVLRGVNDAFVAKLDPTGAALVYSTYLGGSLGSFREAAHAIAVDAQGNAYVTGKTHSLDFPVLRAFQPSKAYTGVGHEGVSQAFVTKLDPEGASLVYSSYLGGRSCLAPGIGSCTPNGEDENGLAIAVDAAGFAYVGGRARSVEFPQIEPIQSLANVYTNSLPFVAKIQELNSTTRLYSIVLGDRNTVFFDEAATGVAVDALGNAYAVGGASGQFPTTPGAFQNSAGSGTNAVVFRLSPGRNTTRLAVSDSAPTSAQSVTLTATVTSAVPGGQVTFYDGGVSLATALVTGGTAVHVAAFPAGVHELTAVYSGDNKVSRPLFLPVKQASSN